MPCDNCGHTVHKIAGSNTWWCPRCGGLLDIGDGTRNTELPRLPALMKTLILGQKTNDSIVITDKNIVDYLSETAGIKT